MRIGRTTWRWGVVAALCLPPRASVAKKPVAPTAAPASDDDLARSFFKTGQDLYASGEFLEAARAFEHAFEKGRQPALLYNVASAYDKAGERARALEAYRRYVAAMPAAREAQAARARVAVLAREQAELDAARAPRADNPVEKPAARALPPPLPIVEPTTRASFPSWRRFDGDGGPPYTLVGVGARKVYGFKVYGMGLYVEDEPARRAFPKLAAQAGGADRDSLMHSDLTAQFVVLGDFGKVAELRFVRAVSAKETRDSYRDLLGDAANDRAPTELRRDVESFLALFDDVKEGDVVLIGTRVDGTVWVEAGGRRRVGPTNQRLAHDLWAIWLGAKPLSEELKRSVLDRIDTLGR